MSEGSAQNGWWLASDGRWYPPAEHPDARALSALASAVPAGGERGGGERGGGERGGGTLGGAEPALAGAAGADPLGLPATDGVIVGEPDLGRASEGPPDLGRASEGPPDLGRASEGPPDEGWWIASDGRWYPPELHPDVLGSASSMDGFLDQASFGYASSSGGDVSNALPAATRRSQSLLWDGSASEGSDAGNGGGLAGFPPPTGPPVVAAISAAGSDPDLDRPLGEARPGEGRSQDVPDDFAYSSLDATQKRLSMTSMRPVLMVLAVVAVVVLLAFAFSHA